MAFRVKNTGSEIVRMVETLWQTLQRLTGDEDIPGLSDSDHSDSDSDDEIEETEADAHPTAGGEGEKKFQEGLLLGPVDSGQNISRFALNHLLLTELTEPAPPPPSLSTSWEEGRFPRRWLHFSVELVFVHLSY